MNFFVGLMVMANIEGLHSEEYKKLYEIHNNVKQQDFLADDRQIETLHNNISTVQSSIDRRNRLLVK